MAIAFSDLTTEVTRLGGLGSSTDDVASATAWAKGGLRMIGRSAAWPWLRCSFTQALTANTYEYALSSLTTNLWRIDTNSLRYGGSDTFLDWGTPEELDSILGPNWKDSDQDGGTPQYAARFGINLWIAKKPDQDFVDDNPNLYGYGWRYDNWAADESINSGNLFLPDEFFEIAVEASLAYGLIEEDDPRADSELQRARMMIREEMMGAAIDVGAGRRMVVPDWALHSWTTVGDYGDGNAVSY